MSLGVYLTVYFDLAATWKINAFVPKSSFNDNNRLAPKVNEYPETYFIAGIKPFGTILMWSLMISLSSTAFMSTVNFRPH